MQNTFLLNHRSGILGSDCQSQKGSPPTHQMILQSALHKYLELVVETLTKTAGFLTTKILLSWQLELQLECLLAALWRNLNPGQLQQKGAKSGHPSCFSSTPLAPRAPPQHCHSLWSALSPRKSGQYENCIVEVGTSVFVLVALMCGSLGLHMSWSKLTLFSWFYWNIHLESV